MSFFKKSIFLEIKNIFARIQKRFSEEKMNEEFDRNEFTFCRKMLHTRKLESRAKANEKELI